MKANKKIYKDGPDHNKSMKNCPELFFVKRFNNKQFFILTQHIKISEILAWVRNSYLTHVILPRLSRDYCSLVAL